VQPGVCGEAGAVGALDGFWPTRNNPAAGQARLNLWRAIHDPTLRDSTIAEDVTIMDRLSMMEHLGA
jgi:hypothetical protein